MLTDLGDTVEALIAGDRPRAFEITETRLRAYDEMSRSLQSTVDLRTTQPVPTTSDRTRSAMVARRMLSEIRGMGWPVGASLGTETDLLARFDVSRATFRQALRTLEQYSAVESRRGRQGGLFVAAPDPKRVVDNAVAALQRSGASTADAFSLLAEMRILALDLVLAAKGAAGLQALAAAAPEVAGRAERQFGDLLNATVEAAGNGALAFVLRLLEDFVGHAMPAADLASEFYQSVRRGDLVRARRALMQASRAG
jgi:DNA-binding FadR family transcriptional regulator